MERMSCLEAETCPGDGPKHQLETLVLSFEQSKRHYRRRLAARLACAFCVLMLVAIAICLACVAMLLHIEPPRGVLVAMEGTLEMIPSNGSHCVVGKPEVISEYKSSAIKDVENRLDSVFGSMSAASRYVGALVEDFRCLLRPAHPGVRVEVDFTLFWRRRRNRYGILSASPGQHAVADALHRELSRFWITGFKVDLDSITLADSRVIA